MSAPLSLKTCGTSIDFNSVKPGDFISYTLSDPLNAGISFLQSLDPRVTPLSATQVHSGIVVAKGEGGNTVTLAHTLGPEFGACTRTLTLSALKKRTISFASPIGNGEEALEMHLRSTLVRVAQQFAYQVPSKVKVSNQTCSYVRLARAMLQPNVFTTYSKWDVAESLTDFIAGTPRIQSFDKQGRPIGKGFVCTEFAYTVYQTAYFYNLLQASHREIVHNMVVPVTDQKTRAKAIKYIFDNFDSLFPQRLSNPKHLAYQHSLSFTPGRLLSEIERRGHDILVVSARTMET